MRLGHTRLRVVGTRLLPAVIGLLAISNVATAAGITWRVAEPFPAFGDIPPDVASSWLLADEGKEPLDAWYRRVSADGASPFDAYVRNRSKGPWDAGAQEYRDDFLKQYVRSSEIDVLLSADGAEGACTWQIGPATTIQGSCKDQRAPIPKNGAVVSVRGKRLEATSTTVAPKRLIVVGLGDSYASGEGNPDRATRWRAGKTPPTGKYLWLGQDEYFERPAAWWDGECHRSFWSHQTMTALRLASESRERQVVFLHYACSGAEVFDGLLLRQKSPPGRTPGCDPKRGRDCLIRRSQLRALVEDLCPATASPNLDGVRSLRETIPELRERTRDGKQESGRSDLLECPVPTISPDLVLLSIGGNDAGFAGLVLWAILPETTRSRVLDPLWQIAVRGTTVVCPRGFIGGSGGCRRFDDTLRGRLPRRIDALTLAFDTLVNVRRDRIVYTAYPDPIRKTDGAPPYCNDPPGENHDGPWQAARTLGMPRGSQLNIVRDEAQILAESTLPKLRETMRTAAEERGLTFIDRAADAFIGHGWCQIDPGDPAPWLPSTVGKTWELSSWRGHAPMGRFIRTLNDSMLTQSSTLSDDHTGTAHPTAQGQAAIAEAIRSDVDRVIGER